MPGEPALIPVLFPFWGARNLRNREKPSRLLFSTLPPPIVAYLPARSLRTRSPFLIHPLRLFPAPVLGYQHRFPNVPPISYSRDHLRLTSTTVGS